MNGITRRLTVAALAIASSGLACAAVPPPKRRGTRHPLAVAGAEKAGERTGL